jgi:ornithine cyclodeaminase/alanine dehydrogenase-like protein (mu-crystallin family)
MLVLSRHDVEAVLDVRTCMQAMEAALAGLSRGTWRQPPRAQVRIDGTGILMGLMPAYRDVGERLLALKDILLVPDNRARGLPIHQGAVLLHDGTSGCLLAIVDATAVTVIRTAAVSAVATRVLAPPDTTKVAILGTGVQACRHVEAMRTILPAAEIVVWGRSPDRAATLGEQMDVRASTSVERRRRGRRHLYGDLLSGAAIGSRGGGARLPRQCHRCQFAGYPRDRGRLSSESRCLWILGHKQTPSAANTCWRYATVRSAPAISAPN